MPEVAVGVRMIDRVDEAQLHELERAIVAGAVAKRRAEFASGRVLLRSLLATNEPVTVLSTRAPSLPAGVVASLAHDAVFVVAAVTTDRWIAALGIDIEPVDAVTADIVSTVLRDDERDIDPTLAFVAKEATYKAWSSLGGRVLDHLEVQLAFGNEGAFTATIVDDHRSFVGRSLSVGRRWLALVVDIGNDGRHADLADQR